MGKKEELLIKKLEARGRRAHEYAREFKTYGVVCGALQLALVPFVLFIPIQDGIPSVPLKIDSLGIDTELTMAMLPLALALVCGFVVWYFHKRAHKASEERKLIT